MRGKNIVAVLLAVVLAAPLLHAAPPRPTLRIAVLPFSGPAKQAWIGRALSLAVADRLLQAPRIEVISQVAVERARFQLGKAATPEAIARRSGAYLVVTGRWTRDAKGRYTAEVWGVPQPVDDGQIQGRIAFSVPGVDPQSLGLDIAQQVLAPLGRRISRRGSAIDARALETAARGAGQIFGSEGQRDVRAGLKQLSRAVVLDSDFLAARLLAAEVYLVAGQPGQAVALLDKTAAERARAAELLGRAYEQAGQPSKADEAYRKAIALAPGRCAPRVALGDLLASADRGQEAEAQYDQALAADDDCGEAHFSKGLMLHRAGKLDAALQRYERAAARLPGDPDVHYYRGLILAAQDNLEPAIAALRQAIQLSPLHHDAWRNLGVALLKTGRRKDASSAFRTYLECAPPDDAHIDKVKAQLEQLNH